MKGFTKVGLALVLALLAAGLLLMAAGATLSLRDGTVSAAPELRHLAGSAIGQVAASHSAPLAPNAAINVTTLIPDANPGDGQCSLIEAITNANADAAITADCPTGSGADTIMLAPGAIYTVTLVDNTVMGPSGLPVITSPLTVMGQGATIARDLEGTDPEFRFITVAATGTLSLDNLVLRGGLLTLSGYPDQCGGAILNSGLLTLTNVRVADNAALCGGGILNYGAGARLSVTGSTIVGNSTYGGGAGIYNDGRLSLSQSTVLSNTAFFDCGGGIYSDGASVTVDHSALQGNQALLGGGLCNFALASPAQASITHSSILGNTAVDLTASTTTVGGGIANSAYQATATLYVTSSLIAGNVVTTTGTMEGYGGGISNGLWPESSLTSAASLLTIADSIIRDNTAANGGGIANIPDTRGAQGRALRATVTRSTVSGNKAIGQQPQFGNGGGLFNIDGELTLANSTVSGNAAIGSAGPASFSGLGGGLISADLTQVTLLNVINSTISNNSATLGNGMGNGRPGGPGATATYKNTIIAGNGADNCLNNSTLTSAGYNLEDLNTCGFAQVGDLHNTNPKLGPLADNGGPTWTHALLPGSPAIGAASAATCAAAPISRMDQRGIKRPVGAVCDIGSFEYRALVFVPLVRK